MALFRESSALFDWPSSTERIVNG